MAGCVPGGMSAGHQEKQSKLQGDTKETNVVCEGPRRGGITELQGSVTSSSATAFSSLSALFLPVFVRSRVTLFWFG